ncbi:MAG: imidazole glycerol phosphate synthase subunit HisH [Candidatus Peribacteraceae bacterium]|jgi:glutamine amidotransferase|nr:imidazole glycerol phosphate synthase subunit HisH [Candidatus Peribacteraceae bacterium]|tara:strand:+ start:2953 stop:3570 length:618 start_codon:yes stop_codon:yes gene_type:complete
MIAILDANMGNLRSVFNAVDTMGYDAEIATHVKLSDKYSHLIIPGVGSFQRVMRDEKMVTVKEKILNYANSDRPILGICLGMQLLSDWGEEGGGSAGLGLISGKAERMPGEKNLLLPHVGWNTVNFIKDHPVLQGVKNGIDCYFVHSYHFVANSDEQVYARSSYGTDFVSVVGRDNVLGFQFHPEKSQKNGLKLIENFCNWDGKC